MHAQKTAATTVVGATGGFDLVLSLWFLVLFHGIDPLDGDSKVIPEGGKGPNS
jgi:hypothetical protein